MKPPGHTVPIIERLDLNPPLALISSLEIAKYLHAAFPPPIFRDVRRFDELEEYAPYRSKLIVPHLRNWILYDAWRNLDDRGREYFRRSREAQFCCKLEEMLSNAGGQEAIFENLRKGWIDVRKRMAARTATDLEPTALDLYDGALLMWIRIASEEKYQALLDLWDDESFRKLALMIMPYTCCN
ncbi:hypothetical protein BT69DRAFT_1278658 [Atractiella rhizophila]|nr:hypothetical protein BT69DRAFT_1278658 [Atractiella rhizophila]